MSNTRDGNQRRILKNAQKEGGRPRGSFAYGSRKAWEEGSGYNRNLRLEDGRSRSNRLVM